MTRKLEELFDLPPSAEPAPMPDLPPTKESITQINTVLAEVDKIEAALPMVTDLNASDKEMDDLAEKAISSYDDLLTLGMNVDSRYASDILAVASTMLGHAITARTAKLNKKLKMVDLQLKKLALDRRGSDAGPAVSSGEGHILDRNELLQRLSVARDKDTQKE